MALPNSGQVYINALLQGWSWTGGINTAKNIEYTFRAASELDVNPVLRSAVNTALGRISEVANVGFKYNLVSSLSNSFQQDRFVNGQPNNNSVPLIFEVDNTLTSGLLGLATFPFITDGPPSESHITAVDVAVNATDAELASGGEGFVTLLHEIGHALGLSHSNTGESQSGTALPFVERTSDATVMNSSFPDFSPSDATATIRPQGMQIYDIAALQYLYGANRTFHAGNDVYSFDGTVTQSRTLWDAGGIDIVSTTGFAGDAIIDLREGYQNITQVGSSTAARSNIWLAFGSNIENADAGVGNDTVFGNNLNNVINGGAGNDILRAAQGNDIINGNQGNDNIFGGAGEDLIQGGKDNDTIDGVTGNDNLNGNLGSDSITGNEGNDTIFGNEDNDVLMGSAGNDLLRGGKGDDQLFGGIGNDMIYGDIGNDLLNGGAGADVFIFAAGFGNDTIGVFEAPGPGAVDKILISSAIVPTVDQILAKIVINEAGLVIEFDSAHKITVLGVFAMIASDFAIY